MSTIFVANIPFSFDDVDLVDIFRDFGTVTRATIIKHRDGAHFGKSRGFGFVYMDNPSDAKAAIEGMNGYKVKGRELVVREAEDRRNN